MSVSKFFQVNVISATSRSLGESGAGAEPSALESGQWSKESAWEWFGKAPWPIGCNFLPSSAVNDIEMWQAGSFDEACIDLELGFAERIGFNSVRSFLNFVVWEADREGLKRRFERFLQIARSHGISVMPVLFDDCNFAGRSPHAGKQPDPVLGVHNSQWVSSPAFETMDERSEWTKLESYVKDVIGSFKSDERILAWDLYNEPGNSVRGDKSLPLVEASFKWARELKPAQPLTAGPWHEFESPMSRRVAELSDVVSFHCYDALDGMREKAELFKAYGRPLLCTEWMQRKGGSSFMTHLPYMKREGIGAYSWGLVAGRTQTFFPWNSKPGVQEPELWFHDIFRKDGSPFCEEEVQFVKRVALGKG